MNKSILIVFLSVLLLFAIVGTCSGCKNQNTNLNVESNQSKLVQGDQVDGSKRIISIETETKLPEHDQEVVTYADVYKTYDTIDALKDEATAVVEGNVERTSVYLHKVNDDIVPYTLIELEITNVIKGNTEKGTRILVAEYGGIVTAEQAGLRTKFLDMTDEDANENFLVSFGNELAEPGQKLLLFLSNDNGYQILNVEAPYYMIVGDYYGMFIHDASTLYIQNIPSYAKDSERIVIEDTVLDDW